MTKKLNPSEDPAYFEWEPNDEGGSDEEGFEILAMLGVSADSIVEPQVKVAYIRYLEARAAGD